MAVRERLLAVAGQSERTLLVGTVLLVTAVSATTGFVLTQYYSVDALSSLTPGASVTRCYAPRCAVWISRRPHSTAVRWRRRRGI
jgi:hypothetical protein